MNWIVQSKHTHMLKHKTMEKGFTVHHIVQSNIPDICDAYVCAYTLMNIHMYMHVLSFQPALFSAPLYNLV